MYEAPHDVVFSNLLSPHSSLFQIVSTPCSQTPSVYIGKGKVISVQAVEALRVAGG
jgi:hypothetical protein